MKIALYATRKELAFLRLAHDPIAFGIWELVEDERERMLTKLTAENKRLREELRSIRGEMRSQANRKR